MVLKKNFNTKIRFVKYKLKNTAYKTVYISNPRNI